MTAQQLKNSILQMAVQGKLVPQNPDDEPASVLLERIKAEKQKLIKEGKIKKDKKSSEIFRGSSRNLPYMYYEQVGKEIHDISDKIPFEIPDTWEWCRLGQTLSIFGRIGFRGYTKADMTEKGKGAITISPSNIKGLDTNFDDCSYISWTKYEESPEIQINNNDLLLVKTGSSYGKCGIVKRLPEKATINPQLVVFKHILIDRKYLLYVLNSFIAKIQYEKFVIGTSIPTFSQEKLSSLLLPIPPLSEQKRIVSKIEELLPYIEQYEQAETQLTKLNADFPEMLKKSILQEAVQGKLVPQNLDDEPASVLLERIRAEKQKLIKEGKIKKDKHESQIITCDKIPYEIVDGQKRCIADEVSFEIPDSWCWCRLSALTTKITDGTHHSPPNVENGEYKYITAKNIKDEGISLANVTYVTKEIHDEIFSRCNPEYGDVLLIKDGATTGIATVNNIEEPFSLLSSVALIKCPQYINSWYLVYVLRSDLFYKNIRSQMKGTGITRITLKQIEPLLIPVPPLAEQKRIVAKIEELMPFITAISK